MTAGSISTPYIIPLRVGQTQKFLIDTNTLIEIRSDTHDVDIYYTLDGSKPDAFITLTARRATIAYKKPFYIPRERASAGKVTIKAIAVSRDGIRESNVVTKVFDVKIVPTDHVRSDEYENRYLHELQQERQDLMVQIQNENERMHQNLSESLRRSAIDSFVQENPSPYRHPYPSTPSTHLPQQANVLRCAHCYAPKTTDSYTRFCTECGLPWQKLTNNPPEPNSTKICSNCKSTIPFNSNSCVVCETRAPIEPQQRPTSKTQATVLCPHCKLANPTHLRTCYICECALLPTTTPPEKRSVVSVPTIPKPAENRTMMTCSKCLRLNNPEARFCDWCGAYPEQPLTPVQCTKCHANNDPCAKFCSTCGCVIEPPLRIVDTRLRNDSNLSSSSMIASTLTRQSASPVWLNASTALTRYQQPSSTRKHEAATQTYGIYYPSAKDIDLIITQNKKLLDEQELKEYRPVLTSTSPGKGYWRQQLDHVAAHLRAYAVNQPDFQALIGEPRLGKMIHATVHENEYQVTVQAVFQKPQNLAQSAFFHNETNDYYPTRTGRSSAFSNSFDSDSEYSREQPHKTKVKHHGKKRPKSANLPKTDSPKYALIELLEKKSSEYNKKSSHRIDVLDEVQRLLNKNANPNTKNKDGYSALHLAVINGHHECIETLIKDGGAKIDQRGPRGNTALHECCLLEADGAEPLRILLKHGGDPAWLNDKKESVVDLATRKNHQELLQVFVKYHGDKMIQEQTKSYYDDRARTKPVYGYRSSEKS
ncbi:unnamed protein product [Rotaria socialis]|uniref:Double zinc ribbon and ankyrin repeat-containing protein 1 n=1 Tax=Rotaria socialis TaxID=392032 RepID=A0A819Y9S1_9BILA|nr:unnamed protein product [Rotaria socialis]CAF3364507.1 unnamed protein product [Rotaria socialis]CAF3616842.1 unnamed protein product [Rotaria socialis]CAF3659088.1 unnamed protein product [Rotaria socialis]CAF4152914.1 unnamed protein product [Rotaria socialis]